MKVEIYSDVACPWCYIGDRRFQLALEAYPQAEELEIVFRPFQLDPGASETPVPLPEALQRKFGSRAPSLMQHVGSAALREGIDISWNDALSVNTLNAHRLLRLAELEYGAEVQRKLAEALFEAHFVNGANVAAVEQLAELAEAAGMDRERARTYLSSGEGAREVQQAIARAQQMGIRAVPTFVFEEQFMVEGAQPASTFLQVLEQVAEQLGAGTAQGAADDFCSDGACTI